MLAQEGREDEEHSHSVDKQPSRQMTAEISSRIDGKARIILLTLHGIQQRESSFQLTLKSFSELPENKSLCLLKNRFIPLFFTSLLPFWGWLLFGFIWFFVVSESGYSITPGRLIAQAGG